MVVCFSFSIINSRLMELEVFMASLYPNTSNSVYVGNLGDFPVCFLFLALLWAFYEFLIFFFTQ